MSDISALERFNKKIVTATEKYEGSIFSIGQNIPGKNTSRVYPFGRKETYDAIVSITFKGHNCKDQEKAVQQIRQNDYTRRYEPSSYNNNPNDSQEDKTEATTTRSLKNN